MRACDNQTALWVLKWTGKANSIRRDNNLQLWRSAVCAVKNLRLSVDVTRVMRIFGFQINSRCQGNPTYTEIAGFDKNEWTTLPVKLPLLSAINDEATEWQTTRSRPVGAEIDIPPPSHLHHYCIDCRTNRTRGTTDIIKQSRLPPIYLSPNSAGWGRTCEGAYVWQTASLW